MMTVKEVIGHLYNGHVPPRAFNGKNPRYSASTVKQFKRCERKHYFEQVIGLPVPITEALSNGTKTHAVIEKYLKTGAPPRTGAMSPDPEKWAATGLKHLPLPMAPGLLIEVQRSMGTWPNGPMLTGTPDLMRVPPEGDDDSPAFTMPWGELWDHKTTSGYARGKKMGWVLTPETLPDDEQCIIYSTFAFGINRQLPGVKAKWVYYDKSGAEATAVLADMERKETLAKHRERIWPVVEGMQTQHVARPSLMQVPMNGVENGECEAFKGCPHRAYCVDYKGTNTTPSGGVQQAQDSAKEKLPMGKLSQQILGKGETAEEVSQRNKVKEAHAKEDAANGLNPPPQAGGNPFQELPKAEAKTETKSAAKATKETNDTKSEAPKAPAATGGFNLLVGCSIEKGSKREVIHVFELLTPVFAEVRRTYKGDWAEAIRFGEDKKRAAVILASQLDDNPELLAGKNVRAPLRGTECEIAMSVLAPRAAMLIMASAV